MADSGIWVPPGGSADPRREQQQAAAPPSEHQQPDISPEELAEQLRRIRVSDVVLSLLPTLAQLGYATLDPDTRDLAEARVAIDALRALLPVLEGAVPDELTRDYRQVVTNMQLAYASAADEGAQPAAEAGGPAAQAGGAPATGEAEDSEREAGRPGEDPGAAPPGSGEQERADG